MLFYFQLNQKFFKGSKVQIQDQQRVGIEASSDDEFSVFNEEECEGQRGGGGRAEASGSASWER